MIIKSLEDLKIVMQNSLSTQK